MSTNIELAKPRDFGEIVSDSFNFIKQNFKPLLKYFFILCGFFILATTALSILTQIKVFRAYNDFNPNSFDNENRFSRLYSLSGGYLFYFLFLALEYVAINVMVLCFVTLYKQKQNQVPEMDEMWGYFKYHYFRILGSSIVLFILLIAGMMFCLIPGIYLYPIFALIPSIMVIENTSFGYAFNQSFRLIKDNWWLTFGTLVTIYIVIYVASVVILMPSTIFSAGSVFFHFTKKAPVSLTAAIITAVLQQAVHIFYILLIVASSLCYFNLTESKEGTGLIERINQFGSSDPKPDQTQEEY